jgi:DGQHR domain-containing protein
MNSTIEITALRVRQDSRDRREKIEFFISKMKAHTLRSIASTDLLRLADLEAPKYKGIQRALSKERVKQIEKFLETFFPIMPNSIIIALHGEQIETLLEQADSQADIIHFTLDSEKVTASIIDGQHRVAGLRAAPDDYEVPVTIFIDPPLDQKAYIFNKINSTQKTVNPSISYQLFGYSKYATPQKFAHEIVMALSQAKSSPFRKKMRLLGTKDDWADDAYALTQSTFAKELLRLVSRNPVDDEYEMMRPSPNILDDPRRPLRQYWRDYDVDAVAIISQRWFSAISSAWPDEWDDTRNFILSKSTGISAWWRALHKLFHESGTTEFSKQNIERKIAGLKSQMSKAETPLSFTSEDFASNESGINALRDVILKGIRD